MSGKSYVIKGIGRAGLDLGDHIPVRREIDEWWFDQDLNTVNQKSLFIYALARFQARGWDKSDDLSYFSIAGIHGQPLTPWPSNNPDQKEDPDFYCAHGRVTFSTWHTPYMLLYEQRLWEEMHALIPDVFAQEDHEVMYRAANTWRLPYWDFAMKKPNWNSDNPADPVNDPKKIQPEDGPNVPFIFTQKEVEVKSMSGATKFRNPFYQYGVPAGRTFGDYNVLNYSPEKIKQYPDYDSPWIPECRTTSRRPRLPDDLDATKWRKGQEITPAMKEEYASGSYQNWKDVQTALQGGIVVKDKDGNLIYKANSLPEAVNRLFDIQNGKSPLSFEQFSTTKFTNGQPLKGYPSLEAIHNNIHDFTGGYGYMGDPATSAFDPIFWLHHCNVDRLLALWQTLFSEQFEEWIDGEPRPNDDSETPLTPFTRDENFTMFNSTNSSKMFREFGYTYPELEEWRYETREEWLDAIKKTISTLYATTALASLQLKENQQARDEITLRSEAEDLKQSFFPVQLVAEAASSGNGAQSLDANSANPLSEVSWKNNDYVVNVVYERFALGGLKYFVAIFLGQVPTGLPNFDLYSTETAVSEVYNFSSPAEGRGVSETGCANCKDQADNQALFSGQVILTDALIAKIVGDQGLSSLDQNEVVAYLKENLRWRVIDARGVILPRDDPRMRNLKVSVAMAEATHYATAGKQTEYTEYEHLFEITDSRPYGASASDQIYLTG